LWKTYIQQCTNSHSNYAFLTPQNLVSDPQGSGNPRLGTADEDLEIEWQRTKTLGVRKNVGRSTHCGCVDLQANVSAVGRFANMHIALNHEWNITGNYAVSMHKTLEHWCVHYKVICHLQRDLNGSIFCWVVWSCWGSLLSFGWDVWILSLLRTNLTWVLTLGGVIFLASSWIYLKTTYFIVSIIVAGVRIV